MTGRLSIRGLVSIAWLRSLTLLVVVAIGTVGCLGGEPGTTNGWATITFDGITLGDGPSEYPRVNCRYGAPKSPPMRLTPSDRSCCGDVDGDWIPSGGGPRARLILDLDGSVKNNAIAEFRIGDAVYRTDASTTVKAPVAKRSKVAGSRAWAGKVTFIEVPLVSGPAYAGRTRIDRLAVEWECIDQEPGGRGG